MPQKTASTWEDYGRSSVLRGGLDIKGEIVLLKISISWLLHQNVKLGYLPPGSESFIKGE